ncbi:hypothetical protein EV401DRAFT_1895572 [Pisolithus croceorrhizus]|nr:hypothetical protein EV401DRAFT_1895572 [Pisolithus croceorrhizus]
MASSAVPTLTLDGRNWKLFQANLLEVAATKGWLGVLSGQGANEESLQWEGKDAQLKMVLYQTVPIPLVLKIQKLRTSHNMFNYLATTFQDPTPISIPTKKPIKASSDNKMQEPCTKPNELSVEPPSEERLEDELTKARSNDKAEAADGMAQQVLSQSIEANEYIPGVPSDLCMAQSELDKQLSLRAGKPLESEHIIGMVEMPDEVENVNRKAHEDLPMKLCNGSTKNKVSSANALPLEGEQAACASGTTRQHKRSIEGWRGSTMVHVQDIPDDLPAPQPDTPSSIKLKGEWNKYPSFNVEPTSSGNMNSQSHYPKKLQLTVYDPGGTLQWPTAHSQEAEVDEGGCRVLLKGELAGCASDSAGESANNMQGALLEGEQARYVSSTKTNLQGHTNTSRAPSIGDVNVPTSQNVPVEAPSTMNLETTFGQPTSPDEGCVARGVKGKTAGGNGEPTDGKDNMTNGGKVDSEPVEAALLAGDSQDVQSQNPKNVPMGLPDQGIHEDESNSKLECIRTSRNLTIESRTLEECPESIREWCNVNMNMSSQIRGPAGQDKVSEMLGVIKGEWTCQDNGKRVQVDGWKCQMDGTTSSRCCNSKQVKTKLLAEGMAGQQQQQQRKPGNIPGPPTKLQKHTYESTRLRHQCGQIKIKSRKVSRLQKGKDMYQRCDNAIACPQEGIGTL